MSDISEAPPRVSVCIRACSRPRALGEAIASVVAQSFADFEVVVSDDSGELGPTVAAFADARVHYHANPAPAGPTANLLNAVSVARGELLAVLDDDDRWMPEFLATVIPRFDDDPELGVVFTGTQFVAGGQAVPRVLPCAPGRHDAMLRAVLEHSITPSAAVIRRTAWDEALSRVPLRPDMAGAATLWLSIAAGNWPFFHVAEPLAEYHLHAGQMSWSDAGTPSRWAATLERFTFDDEETERLRVARLSEAKLASAGIHLRRGEVRHGLRLLRHARLLTADGISLRGWLALTGIRRTIARFLSRHPRVLAAGLPLWQRVRPAVR